jgi:hypothetical protein
MLRPSGASSTRFWLGAETVNAERSILYFGELGVGTDILRLLAWTAVAVALLLPPVSRKRAHQRKRSVVAGALDPSTRHAAREP